ncbi:MAG: PAS domain S-box protein [Anaerolineales bacterium]|nr:PAS domain S-box protein [Anaerolineales bacterium]
MSRTNKRKDPRRKLPKFTWWIVAIWTAILMGLLIRDLNTIKLASQNLALREARAHFQKDETFRFWSATHGGFYVPIDERTPPSPYLAHIPERDIETPSGEQLTLMNPAYALRQMNEEFAETYGVAGHITSLLPLRPENAPDDWERLALESFEVGKTEVLEFVEFAGQPSLRLMQPLITQEGCLKCHAHQGYAVGDVRGGVSVAVPLVSYLAEEEQATRTISLSYAFIWVLGFGSIIYGSRIIMQHNFDRDHANKMLQESHDKLETRIQERTSELQAEITMRKQVEKEILHSRNQQESIFRVAPTGIGVVIDRKIQFVNDRFTEILGYGREELIGNSARMVYPSDAEFERVGKYKYEEIKEKGTGTIETKFKKKDGTLIDVLLSSTPSDLQDLSQGVIFTALDITERVRAEKALQESETHYRQLFDSMPYGGEVIDTEGKIINCSLSTSRMLGYEIDELIGKKITNFIDEEHAKKHKHNLAKLLKGGTDSREVVMIHKDGRRINVLRAPQHIYNADNEIEGILVLSIDITERVRAEEERRQMEIHLRQQQKLESIGTLASGVAHEINNPITGIMNYAQLIHDRLDPSEAQLYEFSTGIIDETRRVAAIVSNLLAFSRQEKQFHSLAVINDIINDTLSLTRAVFNHDQITLEVDLPEDLPQIKCRSQQVQQVLMNLLTNARDALNERYPEYDPDKIVCVSVRSIEKEGQRWLRTTIEDHGVGIPAETRERIFDPFYTTKDRTLGTGLGLSISLGIVRDHRGELTFESEENQPTRFYLDLPVDNEWELV